MTVTTLNSKNETVSLREDATIISVVALAHGTSHFFQLMLPPLFPWLAKAFSLSFAELGALASALYVVSALGQAASGFLVDRVGARPVMLGALLIFVAAAVVGATADGYSMLMVAALLAGSGNSPFHPADYSILNQRVSAKRLGHAYSAHGITGSLGYATAALVPVAIATAFSWRTALLFSAAWALLVWVVVFLYRDAVTTSPAQQQISNGHGNAKAVGEPIDAAPSAFSFMKLPIVWMCFSFFFVLTFAAAAIQNFGTPAIEQLAGLSVTTAATALTGYLVLGAVGQFAGGFLVGSQRFDPEICIAGALTLSAAFLLVAAFSGSAGYGMVILVMLAGLGSGIAVPSRDLLIKRATPKSGSGRVYGMVYSGLDAGLSVAAPIFGWFMDHGLPRGIFIGAAMAMICTMLLGLWVGRKTKASVPA
jgi:MFS transporter, FSR family, fosmidomycin resistance protein